LNDVNDPLGRGNHSSQGSIARARRAEPETRRICPLVESGW
jgi:hypothetical protein